MSLFNNLQTLKIESIIQVIYAEDLNDPGLQTFGFSLSGGMDLDTNNYPDLVVGAYSSDRAIIFGSRAVVNVTSTLKLEPDSINLEDKGCSLIDGTQVPCVVITLCLQYNGFAVASELREYI